MSLDFTFEGELTSSRVLEPHNGQSRFEASYGGKGTFANHEVTFLNTYVSVEKKPGTYLATGYFLITTTDGAASALLEGTGSVVRAHGEAVLNWDTVFSVSSSSKVFRDLQGTLARGVIKNADNGRQKGKLT
ncbi:hypothetical protein [Streptomyces sp. NPDC088348]|uniref:hypothetical protein n=1 Tax=Streptomyces sp. NPDC088348 TaxID=3365853 RepID=UPI00381D588D